MCTLVAVSLAGATVAAESHWVCEGRIGLNGAAGQYSCAVFHLVIGTTSLDKEAWPKYVPHVAVLFTTNKHKCRIFQFTLLIDWCTVCLGGVVGIKKENKNVGAPFKVKEKTENNCNKHQPININILF